MAALPAAHFDFSLNGLLLPEPLVDLDHLARRGATHYLASENKSNRFKHDTRRPAAMVADAQRPAVALTPYSMGQAYVRIKTSRNICVAEIGEPGLQRRAAKPLQLLRTHATAGRLHTSFLISRAVVM